MAGIGALLVGLVVGAAGQAVPVTVKLFLVVVGDAGRSGEEIGCEDSLVAVDHEVAPTAAPLTATLKDLLSLHDAHYGESGLYNALAPSHLRLTRVRIRHGVAEIQLSGDLVIGGACDVPRIAAQLVRTVTQFPTVDRADIYVDNQPLANVLAGM